jgi:hypothetical protein
VSRTITITNVGKSDETYSIQPVTSTPGGGPTVATNSVQLAAGASVDVPVVWNAGGLAAGAYEGYLAITGSSGTQTHIPYWYAVPSGIPARITVLDSITSGRRRSSQSDAVLFRITDASGLSMADAQPQVTAIGGGGTVQRVVSHDDQIPGLFGINVQLGPTAGQNVFRIQVGDLSLDVIISGS